MAKTKKGLPFIPMAILLLLASALMLPTFVFIFVAMLPTIVAIVTGKASYGYKWVCIMGLNMAGMLPYLFHLWMGVHDMIAVLDILLNVSNMIVIYGSAMIGWLFYVFIPPIMISLISISDKQRVKTLRKRRENLVKKWGNEVVGEETASIE